MREALARSFFYCDVAHKVLLRRQLIQEQDSLAERSKAVAQGPIPQGRGLEPHSCHLLSRPQGSREETLILTTCTTLWFVLKFANPHHSFRKVVLVALSCFLALYKTHTHGSSGGLLAQRRQCFFKLSSSFQGLGVTSRLEVRSCARHQRRVAANLHVC